MKRTWFARYALFLPLAMSLSLLVYSLKFQTPAFAAGMTQHQFMADIAAELTTTQPLKDYLTGYTNAYRVGASFPDTGYASFNDELSSVAHRTSFIDAFVEHIRAKYSYPYDKQRELISFVMGVSSHVADDSPYHNGFIREVAEQDFNGNYDLAHTFCDAGLEFPAIVDFDLWETDPHYTLPLKDIEEVYASMGCTFPPRNFLFGTMVILAAGHLERYVADFLYQPLERIMPWAYDNYYSYPDGGLYNGGELSAAYYQRTWDVLMASGSRSVGRRGHQEALEGWDTSGALQAGSGDDPSVNRNKLFDLARRSLEEGTVEIPMTWNPDGSVSFSEPEVIRPEAWDALVDELITYLSVQRPYSPI